MAAGFLGPNLQLPKHLVYGESPVIDVSKDDIKASSTRRSIVETKINYDLGLSSTLPVCPSEIIAFRRSLTEDHLEEMIEDFHDPESRKTISCLIRSPFLDFDGKEMKHYRDREVNLNIFQNWIERIGKIGSGTYGTVYSMKINGNYPSFLKMAKNERDVESLIYEGAIGILVINKFRQWVPNFCYTYAMIKLPNIFLRPGDQERGVFIRSEPLDSFPSIIVEYIHGDNLAHFVNNPDCTYEVFANILLQLSYSLQFALENCEFNHRDLHPGNVMIKDLGEEYQIKYPLRGTVRYLRCRYLAVMIDFGFARTKEYPYEDPQLKMTRESYPFFDIHSLLFNFYFSRRELLGEIAKNIYQGILTKVELEELLKRKHSCPSVGGFNCRITSTRETSGLNYLFLEKLVFSNGVPSFVKFCSPFDDIKEFNCMGLPCKKMDDRVAVDKTPPKTIFDIYEDYHKMPPGTVDAPDPDTAKRELLDYLDPILIEMKELLELNSDNINSAEKVSLGIAHRKLLFLEYRSKPYLEVLEWLRKLGITVDVPTAPDARLAEKLKDLFL
jgi:serine/threonine protein kinase